MTDMSKGKVFRFLCSLSSDSYSLLLYEKVSWHRADSDIITVATHVDTLNIDYTDFSRKMTVKTVSPQIRFVCNQALEMTKMHIREFYM